MSNTCFSRYLFLKWLYQDMINTWYNSRSSKWTWSATDSQYTHHKDAGPQKARVRLRPQNVGEGNKELQRSRDRRFGESGYVNRHEQTHQGSRNQICFQNPYRPPIRGGNVIFSVASVSLSVQEGLGVPWDHYPWCIESHSTALPPPPPPRHVQTRATRTSLYRVPARHVLTCSKLDLTVHGTPPLPPPTCRTCLYLFNMKHVWLASGRLASYWNASLLSYFFPSSWIYRLFLHPTWLWAEY